MKWRLFGAAVLGLLLVCASLVLWSQRWLAAPMQFSQDQHLVLTISPGDTLNKIAFRLQEQGVLNYPKLLSAYARLTEQTKVKIGEYHVPVGTSPLELLALLQSDAVIEYSVTLVEGKTFKDFLATLAAQSKIKQTLSDLEPKDIIKQLDLDIQHPEGWFFPDTYAYTQGTTDAEILKRAHRRMQHILDQLWQQRRDKNLPYKSAYEALIMASIVEKETGDPSERERIAGVFVRRLNKRMKLQTDPTVIYGLGDRYQGDIRRRHLREATPYNTYVIKGLPPTPIAMPGREAIYAALHPAQGDELFFVAKGNGSHYFSATLAEHNQAVRKYQIEKRRADYRSAPAKP